MWLRFGQNFLTLFDQSSRVDHLLDLPCALISGVNLIKNTAIAIYDAAEGDVEGAEHRAIAMFASAISTATLGAGDAFVVAGEGMIAELPMITRFDLKYVNPEYRVCNMLNKGFPATANPVYLGCGT